MAAKFVIFACALAAANAGYLGSPVAYAAAPGHYSPSVAVASHAITSQSDNILRSPGNLAQISTSSKTIETPYSSVSKSDVRVSNPGVYATHAYAPAPVAYSAPLAHGPVAYAAPAYAHSAPVYSHAAPAYAHSAPVYSQYSHAAPAYAHAAPVVAKAGLLGVAYSPAVAVSHMSYSSPVGVAYAW